MYIFAVTPVRALAAHLERSQNINANSDRPVFSPLNYPFSSLSASSIANILNKVIELAGLRGLGFSAKSFRPTGPTAAIDNGMDPDRIQVTGRWKSQECSENLTDGVSR